MIIIAILMAIMVLGMTTSALAATSPATPLGLKVTPNPSAGPGQISPVFGGAGNEQYRGPQQGGISPLGTYLLMFGGAIVIIVLVVLAGIVYYFWHKRKEQRSTGSS